MKKGFSVLLVFAVILSLFVGIPRPAYAEGGKEVFLSNSGSDGNPGTPEAPLRTFRQALSDPEVEKITLVDNLTAAEIYQGGSSQLPLSSSTVTINRSVVINGAGHAFFGLFKIYNSNLEVTIENITIVAPKAPMGTYSHCIDVGYVLLPSPQNVTLNVKNSCLKFAELDECESYFVAIGFAAVDSKLIIDNTEIRSHICICMQETRKLVRGELENTSEYTPPNSSVTIRGNSALYSNNFIHPEAIPSLNIQAGSTELGGAIKIIGDDITLNLEDGLLTHTQEPNPWESTSSYGILITGDRCAVNMSGGAIQNTTSTINLFGQELFADGIKIFGNQSKIFLDGGKIETSGTAVGGIGENMDISINGSSLISEKDSALVASGNVLMTDGCLIGKNGLKLYAAGQEMLSLKGGMVSGTVSDLVLNSHYPESRKTSILLSDQVKLENGTIFQYPDTVFVINHYQSDTTNLETGKYLSLDDIFPESAVSAGGMLPKPPSDRNTINFKNEDLDPETDLTVQKDGATLTFSAAEVKELKQSGDSFSITIEEANLQEGQTKETLASYTISMKNGEKAIDVPCVLTLSVPESKAEGVSMAIVEKCEKEETSSLRSRFHSKTRTAACQITSGGTYALTGREAAFSDLDGHWAQSYAVSLDANGIMEGVGGELFSPERQLMRSEAVRLIAVLAEADLDAVSGSSFRDIQPTDWFYQSAVWAAEKNIVYGIGDNQFAPNELVTRGQFAAMLERYSGKEAIAAAKAYTTDSEGNIVDPSRPLTRAEAAVMIDKLLEFLICQPIIV
jgi:hypothetical protein